MFSSNGAAAPRVVPRRFFSIIQESPSKGKALIPKKYKSAKLRLPVNRALVIARGNKVLQVDKYDYTNHYEAKKLRDCKASAHIPEWRKSPVFSPAPKQTEQPIKSKKVPNRRSEFVKTDKDSIMSTKM